MRDGKALQMGTSHELGQNFGRAFDTTYNGYGLSDAFVTKLGASGAGLLYSSYLGGSDTEYGSGIAVDSAGKAYLTGSTFSESDFANPFPTTAGAFDTSSNGHRDGFVTKLDPVAGPPPPPPPPPPPLPPPPPPPPPPIVRCHVPRVIGMKLVRARRTIRRARCSVGRVRRVYAKRARVIRQRPKAGRVLKRGARVYLVVGRRRH